MSSSPISLRCPTVVSGHLDLSTTAGADDGRSQVWTCRLSAGPEGFSGTVSLVAALDPATVEPWLLFPGFFIGNGRASGGAQRWPCLGHEQDLEHYASPSWDFALDRGAYPVLLSRQDNRWFGLSWDPHYRVTGGGGSPAMWGESEPQVGCGFTWQGGQGELRLNLPANEAPIRHARNPHNQATDKILTLPAGAVLTLSVRVWNFTGDARAYGPVLAAVRTKLAADHPAASLPPHADLADAAAHGLLAWHWIEAEGAKPGYFVYTSAFDRSSEFNANNKGTTLGWHFESLGFVGGFPVAFGLLWFASQQEGVRPQLANRAKAVAEACLERWCADGATPWGFFRTSYHPGKARTANGSFSNGAGVGVANDDPTGETPFYGSCWLGDQKLIHARTTADASLYLARCLTLLGEDHPAYDAWRAKLRRSLTAALTVQDDAGRFGQLYDVEAREVARSEGSGGLLWIPALHHAYDLFDDDPAFLQLISQALKKAGAAYAPDVENGWIIGAPEDVDLAPTSEDGYNAVMAYAALHRRFGDECWFDLLRQACDWTLGWRKAYNVRFPARNVLGAAGFCSVGGDFASSHNNHLHIYGCNCIADFAYLAKLSTDDSYRTRAEEHFAYAAQLLCVEDGQWNGQRGMCSEQFYTSDWSIWGDWDPTEHHVQKGSFMGYSHVWCINMILLGLEQYQQADLLQMIPPLEVEVSPSTVEYRRITAHSE